MGNTRRKSSDCEAASNSVMKASIYFRTQGLNTPVLSALDPEALTDLVKMNSDFGLAGLLKLWLAEKRG
ncbi:hypothetical protein SAMN05216339_1216 [Nitrosomonas eutropha]|uniref:Uncharacterized protein n=2 Tax=Nitrosomonas eutropha TaxID=916 RepID=A0A1I7JCT0_9PROT|nr:hypothetical protein SAMN05216339_1216 [Nitrosomonas eutropha]